MVDFGVVDERTALTRFARRAKARLAFARGLEWALRALFHAALVALAAVLIHKLFAVPLPVVPGLLGLVAAAGLVGLVAAFLPGIPLGVAAGEVDRRAGWKERLSSALAVGEPKHPMEAALLQDTASRLGRTSPSELIPLRAPRELKLFPLAALAAAGVAWLMPPFDLTGALADARKKEEERKKVVEVLEKLREKKKELDKSPDASEAVKQLAKKIDELAREFEKNPPSDPKQALAQMNALQDELKKMKEEAGKARAMAERIQDAMRKEDVDAGELGKLLQAGKFEAAARELAKMREKLKNGQLSPEEREKLRKQMDALAEKMAKMGAEDLEKKLEDAAKGLEKAEQEKLEGLQEALSDLEQGQKDEQALADALKDLEDLAEALAKGQKECPGCGKKKKKPGEEGEG